MRHLSLILISALAFAADAPKPLTELQAVKLQNAWLREQLAMKELEQIRAEWQALFAEACKAGGIEVPECRSDLNKRVVVREPAPENPGKKEAKK